MGSRRHPRPCPEGCIMRRQHRPMKPRPGADGAGAEAWHAGPARNGGEGEAAGMAAIRHGRCSAPAPGLLLLALSDGTHTGWACGAVAEAAAREALRRAI